MNPPPPNIYIVGAQCTGKTTLVNALRAHFTTPTTDLNLNPHPPPTIITEVARRVLSTHHFTAHDVRTPTRSLALQQLILQAQATAERDALNPNQNPGGEASWFISDRSGADPIAYAVRYVGADTARAALADSAEWATLRARMREAVVVVCEAGEGVAGWLRDDGVRLMPEDLGEWVGFHGLFCGFLEGEGVRYEVLSAGVGALEERVGFVLGRWRARWRERDGDGDVDGE
jgi:predicted ATPase